MAHDPMHGFDFECLGSSVHMWRAEGNSKQHMHQKKNFKNNIHHKLLQLCEVWSEMYHHHKLCECLVN